MDKNIQSYLEVRNPLTKLHSENIVTLNEPEQEETLKDNGMTFLKCLFSKESKMPNIPGVTQHQ